MYYGDWMGLHGLWWVFGLVVIALLLWRRDGGGTERRRPRETPHDILRRRLASGEIDAQEYEQRKALLDRDSPA